MILTRRPGLVHSLLANAILTTLGSLYFSARVDRVNTTAGFSQQQAVETQRSQTNHLRFNNTNTPTSPLVGLTTRNDETAPANSTNNMHYYYGPPSLIHPKQNFTSFDYCEYHPNISAARTTDPYPNKPTLAQTKKCRKMIDMNIRFNHLSKSPPKFQKWPRKITHSFPALVESTQCSANPDLYARDKNNNARNKCFHHNYFKEIARVPAPKTREEFMTHAQRALPVVFTGYESSIWNWTLDTIIQELGDYKVEIRYGNYSDGSEKRKFKKITVEKFANVIRGKEPAPRGLPPYVGNNKLSSKLKRGLRYDPPPYFQPEEYNDAALWIGPRGSETPLHKDGPDNFAFLLQGVKRWHIFPPDDAKLMKCTKCHMDKSIDPSIGTPNKMFGLCWCSGHNAKRGKKLVLKDGVDLPSISQPYTFDQYAGETLYLPAGWLHSVQNMEETVMLNQWLLYDVGPQSVHGTELRVLKQLFDDVPPPKIDGKNK